MTATLNSTGITYLDGTQTVSNMQAFAALSAGAIGTYAMLHPNGSVAYSGVAGSAATLGATVAGSGLYYADSYGINQSVNTAVAGTWKLFSVSKSADSGSGHGSALFLRIA